MFDRLDESTARFTFNGACGLSAFAAGASIFLRVRELSWQAAVFLVFSVLFCYISLNGYKRYKKLRDARWKSELKKSEDELNQILNHARMNIICEQVTGPLDNDDSPPDDATYRSSGASIR